MTTTGYPADAAATTGRWSGRVVPYAPAQAARYRAAGLWGERTIAQEFSDVARRHGERTAVVAPDGRLTYAELDERSDRMAAGLLELGLRPGDPVLLQVTNRLGSVTAWYALLKAGLVPVCTLALHRAHEIADVARRAGATAHLVEAETRGFDLVEFAREQREASDTLRTVLVLGGTDLPPDVVALEALGSAVPADQARRVVAAVQRGLDPDGVAVLQLSGGTTGTPKLIPRLHAEYWYNARAFAQTYGWDPDSRIGHLIPLVHNAGISCALHPAHSAGATLVLTTADLDAALPLLAGERVTQVLLGHGHYGAVAHPAFPPLLGALRRVVLSGAKVPPELFETFESAGVEVGQMFGMGEGLFLVHRPGTPAQARAHTVGAPLSELDEVVVLEPGGERPVPDGEVGELCCAGPYTIRGYLDAPEHDARAFTSTGLYRTGDLAAVRVVDGQRYVSLEGRIKDVINRGGEKINAEEVETLLLRHPAVRQAAVVPVPDPRLGERACAYVVTDGTALALPDVQEHFAALQVAKFKWPERVEVVGDLPRTLVNKVDKRRLTALASSAALPHEGAPA